MGVHNTKSQFVLAMASGLVASVVMLAFMLAFRLAFGVTSPPELLADWFTSFLPLSLFELLLGAFESSAKILLLFGLIAAQLLLGMLLGLVYHRVWGADGRLTASGNSWANPWVGGLSIALFLWLLAILIVMPAAGVGPLGLSSSNGPTAMTVTTLAESLSFGLSLVLVYRWLEKLWSRGKEEMPVVDQGRRALLRKLAVVPAALLLALGAWQLLAWAMRALSSAPKSGRAGYPDEITPTDVFYVVSKNLIDPTVDVQGWSLEVKGLVANPLALNYQDLKTFPMVEEPHALMCISNEVGGDLVGNANWTGVRLRDILAKAGARPALDVILRASDGYSESIPMSKALEEGTVLAYEMNGEPLWAKHGYPVRLLVPNIYGMKNIKWLTAVEPVNTDYKGYWQNRGWSDDATIKMMSRIDVPADSAVFPLAPVALAGIAFAGSRGISAVEVSSDNGQTWVPMRVKPALSPYAWSLWTGTWQPPGPGSYLLEVRAWDGEGKLQMAVRVPPLPSGASGYDRRQVIVR